MYSLQQYFPQQQPFTWIDERTDGLYTSSFDWSANDIKVFNTSSSSSTSASSSPTAAEQKPFSLANDASAATLVENITARTVPIGGKIYHVNNHHSLATSTPPPSIVAAAATPTAAPTPTPDLLRELEAVLINSTTGSLTPPESPRDQTTSLITLLQEIEPCTSSSNEIDAIVATQAENMVPHNSNHQQSEQQQQQQQQQQQLQQLQPQPSPLSPDPWSSPSAGSSSSCSDSGYDDPDWSPSSPSIHQSTTSNSKSTSVNSSSTRRKRAAATTTEERKMRKKEQNKNAATRYRQKKKQEIEVIIGEERELMDKNDRLKADVTEVTREIRYLKSLLRDLYKAKGLIS